MSGFVAAVRGSDRPVQLLVANQFGINLGFYLLMPFLAAYLTGDLGLAAAAAGLILGVRNLTQQGLFFLGGALADRLGYRAMIIAGCAVRTAAFAALAVVTSVPALLAASAATGMAGALFNPAVRAYLAAAAGERRLAAFAVFNTAYQAGILAGPVVGLVLTAVNFRLACAVGAAVFGVLTVLQVRALPEAPGSKADAVQPGLVAGWRDVLANRPFVLFSLAMTGSYVLTFQVYLALPLAVGKALGGGTAATVWTAALFAVSGLVAVAGQVRVQRWCDGRWSPGRCLTTGLTLMGLAFLPLAVTGGRPAATVAAALLAAVLLAAGTLVAYPYEMNTVVELAGGRLVATHYGVYQTAAGIGIAAGTALTGSLLDASATVGRAVPWLALAAVGAVAALAIHLLDRRGWLAPSPGSAPATTHSRRQMSIVRPK